MEFKDKSNAQTHQRLEAFITFLAFLSLLPYCCPGYDDGLDEEDYQLIAENTGIKLQRKKHRRVMVESDDEEELDEETSEQPQAASREDSFGGRGTSMARQESHDSAMQDEDFAHVSIAPMIHPIACLVGVLTGTQS